MGSFVGEEVIRADETAIPSRLGRAAMSWAGLGGRARMVNLCRDRVKMGAEFSPKPENHIAKEKIRYVFKDGPQDVVISTFFA
jgi:hypothetical protein